MGDLTVLILFPLGCVIAFLAPSSIYSKMLQELNKSHLQFSKLPWGVRLQQLEATGSLALKQLETTANSIHQQCEAICILFMRHLKAAWLEYWTQNDVDRATQQRVQDIKDLADLHETAEVLTDLIQKDGAGSWPPRANYQEATWPAAIHSYNQIFKEMSPLLAAAQPSLDDAENTVRIADFRSRFRQLLGERVNLKDVIDLLDAADAGRWDVFPRDTFNAFYCCIAMCRHAYRWGTVPVVKVAQLEQVVHLPTELVAPWTYLQRFFGCTSESGNNTSCLVLNCDNNGRQIYQINSALSEKVKSSEEAFVRILHEVEVLGLPIYHDIIRAVISFSRHDRKSCAEYMGRINAQLRPLFSSYYDKVHDDVIAISVWLSHVQGFFGWGAGHIDETGAWVKFDGLSGNQSLLFQALDAFLGIDPYLSQEDAERNVPSRQRKVCEVIRKHSFRAELDGPARDDHDMRIKIEFEEIVKRLRVFRSAHRTRALKYLSQPAPERLPMTAGKSLLKADMEQSLAFLDEFMVKRLKQTV